MEIIKTGIKDLDFSKMTLEAIKTYWEKIEGDSLHQILPSSSNLTRLSEVIEELENLEASYEKDIEGVNFPDYDEEYEKHGPEYGEPLVIWETTKMNFMGDEFNGKPAEWGGGQHAAKSFTDYTFIAPIYDQPDRKLVPSGHYYDTDDIYSTPEVIKVLKQWKAYLEKFEAEKNSSEKLETDETTSDKPLWKFW